MRANYRRPSENCKTVFQTASARTFAPRQTPAPFSRHRFVQTARFGL
ncbi:hypothetical protein HMPREF9123_0575 [Neisseria bacilliformis ATCC BAA-1200]|uniref:Uncharacterized protein n=1 Tax=Neisseria bacilliformis ATCC BAA-1200 TaxID=888742 RepID=F2B9X6_9NEIS|nr:hypothetical protein HMPREF9123_0575 [Neisseria bacilliformis ATCC BAA-1200]